MQQARLAAMTFASKVSGDGRLRWSPIGQRRGWFDGAYPAVGEVLVRDVRHPGEDRSCEAGPSAPASEWTNAAPPQQSGLAAAMLRQQPQNWHQTGTSQPQKTKKSAGANLLTFVFLGSSTWARTRDLRINSHIRKVEESGLSC